MSSFYIQQFGCRATQADGAAIERQLLERGCTLAECPRDAEIVVINTCTVTAAADTQARDTIRKIHAQNPAVRIVVTGCYAQRAPEDLALLPGVSWVVGNSHKASIPDLVTTSSSATAPRSQEDFVSLDALLTKNLDSESTSPNILVGDIFATSDVLVAPVFGGEGNHTRPTLKIQDGCNSRCAFCVIPFVRGKSRSLAPDRVIAEVNRLARSGFREIVLSGINLGTWGRDLVPRIEFIDLLRRILDETPVERLRLSSIEPLDVTRELIDLFAANDRIACHFHLPLQSASDRILAAMHRWYRSEHYARRVETIRDRLADAAIGADVIAGFPGETEQDHAATLAFIERLPFTYLHVFSYSLRPGTRAALLPNQVSPHIIKRRARELRALGDQKAAAFQRSQIGRTVRVLTLHSDERDCEITPALSSNYLQIEVPGSFLFNQWFDVRLCDERNGRLLGSPIAIPQEAGTPFSA